MSTFGTLVGRRPRVASGDVSRPAPAPIPSALDGDRASWTEPVVTLRDVADELGVSVAGAAGIRVRGVGLDSTRSGPGEIFVALPGAARHGAQFAGQAVAAGAVAVLTDPAGAGPAAAAGVPVLVVDQPRQLLGGLAARVAGYPARSMTVLAVTGTSGKTTTSYLLEAGLRAAGCHPGLIGTTGTRIDGVALPSALTTPEAPDLQRLLARMAAARVGAVALEVSSHALVLHRVDGLVADVALFTNLGRDHLDFHADMADYLAAKQRLFTAEHARSAVVCVDDGPQGYGVRVAAAARDAGLPTVTVTTVPGVAPGDWSVRAVRSRGAGGSDFTVRGPDGREHTGGVALPGSFNVANAVLAFVGLSVAGIDESTALNGIAALAGVPGRMERIGTGAPAVFVDYAHKPDALQAVLTELRGLVGADGLLGVVFGAGGDRDRGKRPLMGAVAARLADLVVLTDDNPRGEQPAAIRAGVRAGMAGGAMVLEIPDRRAAIGRAVAELGAGDVLLVAGKGAETGQQVGGVRHPFDDRVVVAEHLAARE